MTVWLIMFLGFCLFCSGVYFCVREGFYTKPGERLKTVTFSLIMGFVFIPWLLLITYAVMYANFFSCIFRERHFGHEFVYKIWSLAENATGGMIRLTIATATRFLDWLLARTHRVTYEETKPITVENPKASYRQAACEIKQRTETKLVEGMPLGRRLLIAKRFAASITALAALVCVGIYPPSSLEAGVQFGQNMLAFLPIVLVVSAFLTFLWTCVQRIDEFFGCMNLTVIGGFIGKIGMCDLDAGIIFWSAFMQFFIGLYIGYEIFKAQPKGQSGELMVFQIFLFLGLAGGYLDAPVAPSLGAVWLVLLAVIFPVLISIAIMRKVMSDVNCALAD